MVSPVLHCASRKPRMTRTRQAMWLASASTLASFGFADIAHAAAPGSFEQVSALALAASGVTQATVVSPELPMATQDLRVERLAAPPQPILSAGLIGSQHSVKLGAPARFLGYSNYPAIIATDELRLYPAGRTHGCEALAVIGADCNGVMSWTPDERSPSALEYVYRVYDHAGRFDETAPQPLTLLPAAHAAPLESAVREDFGIVDAAAVRGISFDQAETVRIAGKAPADSILRVSRQITPLEADGRFSAVQIVPGGCQAIVLDVTGGCGQVQSSQVPRGTWAAHIGESAQTPIPAANAGPSSAPSDGLSIDMDPEASRDGNPYRIDVRTDATHVDPVLSIVIRSLLSRPTRTASPAGRRARRREPNSITFTGSMTRRAVSTKPHRRICRSLAHRPPKLPRRSGRCSARGTKRPGAISRCSMASPLR